MKRKELKRYTINEWNDVIEDDAGSWMSAEEAYAVMDGYEERIKELECEIGYYKPHSRFLDSECDKYVATIQQREARIKELEEQRACSKSNLPTEAYAVILKMMDSHCLVGGKIFIKEPDAEKFKMYVTNKVERLFDIVKVKVLDNYEAPKE